MFASHALGPRPGPGPARSLYIHVPFCFHKCHYCDFYSLVDPRDRQEAFTARLCGELEALAPWAAGAPLRTIFIGGGTPSLLRAPLWRELLACLERCFDLSLIRGGPVPNRGIGVPADVSAASADSTRAFRAGSVVRVGMDADAAKSIGGTPMPRGEFTVECNPETVSPELMDTLAAGGVGRVSIGAQSFRPEHLKTLERWHDPANVVRAIDLARAAGIGRQSIDLIFGIPGQTVDQWRDDLGAALALGTEHLSCYNLTYEPGTAMTARLKRGHFTPAEEETEIEMFEATLSTLRAGGLDRYEVSNFAMAGAKCRHNLAYWRQEDWLAAGPSASAHIAGHRWKNIPRLDDYLSLSDRGFAPITDHEPPDARRALAERIMTGLRLAEGVEAGPILAGAGPAAAARLIRAVRGYQDRGLIEPAGLEGQGRECGVGPLAPSPLRWRLTDPGFLLSDGIAGELMGLLDNPGD